MNATHQVTFSQTDSALIITLQYERLGYETNSKVNRKLEAILASVPRLPVILDVSELQVFSSLVLGLLIDTQQKINKTGRRFILVGVSEQNQQAMRYTSVDRLFEIRDSVEQALEVIADPYADM